MLLQSSFPPCDPASYRLLPSQPQQSRPHLQLATATGLFAPPAAAIRSPSSHAASSLSNLFNACRSLQSLMFDPTPAPAPSSSSPVLAPTPSPVKVSARIQPAAVAPVALAPPPPKKLRLRVRKSVSNLHAAAATTTTTTATTIASTNPAKALDMPRKRIVKRAAPRTASRLHRALSNEILRIDEPFPPTPFGSSRSEDEPTSDYADAEPFLPAEPQTPVRAPASSASSIPSSAYFTAPQTQSAACPSTPVRTRIAPEALPLGLDRRDFIDLHVKAKAEHHKVAASAAPVEIEADGSAWTAEDDRILIELVLDKLNVSRAEWLEWAEMLGRDAKSLGRRCKTLAARGEVVLRQPRMARRAAIPSTWRW